LGYAAFNAVVEFVLTIVVAVVEADVAGLLVAAVALVAFELVAVELAAGAVAAEPLPLAGALAATAPPPPPPTAPEAATGVM
jgi:hypothetical protein